MPPDLAPLAVPAFPRAEEYAGAWAIEPSRAALLWDVARRIDLAAHVSQAERPPLKSEAMRQPVGSDGRYIAVLTATGVLMKQRSSLSGGTSTVQLRRDVRQAANNPDVAAILIAIDSPGGTVAGTDDLAADVRAAAAKKPVWAQVEDLGASAAYWLASQAARVYANSPTALVGSIGTIIRVYDVSRAAENEGVKTLVFATGDLKGAGTPGLPVTADQQAYFQRLVDSAQESFDRAVTDGRKFSPHQIKAVRSGEVFSATEALRLGLIDGIQSLDATLQAMARELSGPAKGREKMAATEPLEISVSVDLAEARKQAAAEVRRQAKVGQIAAKHPDIAARAIEEGWDETRAALEVKSAELDALRAARPEGPGVIVRSHDRDCSLQALQAAVLLRSGGRLDHPAYRTQQAAAMKLSPWLRAGVNDADRNRHMEMGHRYSHLSAIDLCREACRLAGIDAPFERHELIRAAFSGGTLTSIFTDSVNARLISTYMEAGDTTADWTQEEDVADFKTQTDIRLTKGEGLKRLPRGGEADHVARSDSAETYKIARYARQFEVDEQDMIDDSLSALSDVPVEMGNAAARLRPDLVYSILLANPNLAATARALFNSTDDNVDTSSALASATLKTGISNMGVKQENGVNLNLKPTHLIVPTSLQFTADELVNSSAIIIAGTAGSVTERGTKNTLSSRGLTPISDARLENGVTDPSSETTYAGSATTWYLACALTKTIRVAYLRGTGRAPQVRPFQLDKGKWGMGWDIKMDIGAKAMDWRGLYRATA